MQPLFAALRNLKQRLNWPLLFSVAFFLLVVGGLAHIALNIGDWLVDGKNAEFKQLKVQGQPRYTSEKEIIAAIKKADLHSFFDLDVKQVQHLVTDLPWVASASVRKQWPDTLQVYVVEHQAVAHWNDDLLLNQNGDVFQAHSDELPADLPRLYGPEGSESEAWRTFKQFHELFAVNKLTLNSLALSERFAWQLWLDNGIRLNLGRIEKGKRVQRFIDLYPTISQREDARIDVVDLRYDTGLAVSYKPLQEQQTELKSKA